jgi:hypothetical protein
MDGPEGKRFPIFRNFIHQAAGAFVLETQF